MKTIILASLVIVSCVFGDMGKAWASEPVHLDGVSGASYTVPMPSRPPPSVLAVIQNWLQTHWFMSLATASLDGVPHVSGVTFYVENNVVYFRAKKDTSKIINIQVNPRVSYTVWDAVEEMANLKALQVVGEAKILDGEERLRIARILEGAPGSTTSNLDGFFKKHGIQPAYHGQPVADDTAVVAVTPVLARFNDNTQGMGHSEVYRFGATTSP